MREVEIVRCQGVERVGVGVVEAVLVKEEVEVTVDEGMWKGWGVEVIEVGGGGGGAAGGVGNRYLAITGFLEQLHASPSQAV